MAVNQLEFDRTRYGVKSPDWYQMDRNFGLDKLRYTFPNLANCNRYAEDNPIHTVINNAGYFFAERTYIGLDQADAITAVLNAPNHPRNFYPFVAAQILWSRLTGQSLGREVDVRARLFTVDASMPFDIGGEEKPHEFQIGWSGILGEPLNLTQVCFMTEGVFFEKFHAQEDFIQSKRLGVSSIPNISLKTDSLDYQLWVHYEGIPKLGRNGSMSFPTQLLIQN